MIYRVVDRQTPNLQMYLYGMSELIKTVNESLRDTELEHTLRDRTPQELTERLQNSSRAFIVVATPSESPDEIAGCYLVTGALSGSQFPYLRHIGWSGSLARHPNYRGMGIGDGLVGRSLEEAKSRGLTELVTETEEKNKDALALLKRFGYIEGTPYPWALWSETWSENDRILELNNDGRILRYRWTVRETSRQTIIIPLHKKLQ